MAKMVIFFLLLAAANIHAQKADTTRKPTAAVLDFRALTVMKKEELASLTNKFRSSLAQTNRFVLLERSEMETILKEQDFTMSDLCNTEDCAVQLGQLLAAEKMITGDLGKVGEAYTVTVRILDVTTGKVEGTASEEYKGPSEGLIKTFDLLAQKLTGIYQPKSRTWMWVAAAVIAGGGASAILLSGKSSSKPSTVGTPPGDPQVP